MVLSASSFKYNGKVRKPSVKTVKGLSLKSGTDYTVNWSDKNPTNAGIYTLTVIGTGKYTGIANATYKITKATNTLNVKGRKATIKYKQLKKKNRKLKVSKVILFKKKGQGKKTYRIISAKKGKKNFKRYFKINQKTGTMTLVKKLKKGIYKVKIKVRAAGSINYKPSAWKIVTIKIKVK